MLAESIYINVEEVLFTVAFDNNGTSDFTGFRWRRAKERRCHHLLPYWGCSGYPIPGKDFTGGAGIARWGGFQRQAAGERGGQGQRAGWDEDVAE